MVGPLAGAGPLARAIATGFTNALENEAKDGV